jgi:hypothetical protein
MAVAPEANLMVMLKLYMRRPAKQIHDLDPSRWVQPNGDLHVILERA